MANNARKHVIPAGSETNVTRATIFEAFGNTIHDVVPVANSTEAAQVVSDLTSAGVGPSSTNPLVVHRADARGLHRLEYTVDGTVWLPASGKLSFASVAAGTSWATANAAYLTVGDQAQIGAFVYTWTGTAWVGGAGTLTPSVGITLNYRLHREGLKVILDLSASKATDMGTGEVLTIIPAEFRPVNQINGGLHLGGGFGFIGSWGSIMTNGEIRANSPGVAGVRNVFFTYTWMRDS